MKKLLFSIVLFAAFVLSCSTPPEKENSKLSQNAVSSGGDTTSIDSTETIEPEALPIPKVIVVPCSNGYLYNSHRGDVNPSLEKHLDQEERIELVPFPYVAMKGAGYFGVFDKKHCDEILKRTDVDFLIMTRMSGLEGLIRIHEEGENKDANWGFTTKILNVESMEQFRGITVQKLTTFEEIDGAAKNKTAALIEMILESQTDQTD